VSCGVGRRRSLDSMLLWLWCRPAAVALIELLAWEPPHAMGVALKSKKKKKISETSKASINQFVYSEYFDLCVVKTRFQ